MSQRFEPPKCRGCGKPIRVNNNFKIVTATPHANATWNPAETQGG